MKKLIAFVLICILTVSCFAGCGSEKDKLIGTWKGTMDLTEAITASMDLADMEGHFPINNFQIAVTLTFAEDGTYTLQADPASVEAATAQLLEDMKEGLVSLLQEQITLLGLSDMTVEQLLAMSGKTMDDLIEESKQELAEQNIPKEISAMVERKGQFLTEDGKLYTSASAETTPAAGTYEVFTIEGDVLTLVELVGGDPSVPTVPYPMTFKKS